jgi:hypothetical protein
MDFTSNCENMQAGTQEGLLQAPLTSIFFAFPLKISASRPASPSKVFRKAHEDCGHLRAGGGAAGTEGGFRGAVD